MSTLENGDRRSPELDPPSIDGNIGVRTPKISVYERTREERIRANLERMQKLGLKELSLNLNSLSRTKPKQRKSYSKLSQKPELSSPRRRSSRLQNMEPPSYAEGRNSKRDALEENEGVKNREGSKPEVYSEEQVKRLGGTERSWTLFVDGYGKDGRRIYDPINGKTCHQCRQKTLGHRTHCSNCEGVRGQFCGDCLYMRYGEHVLEALEDPNWTCPVCRGICNCSFCRQAKGFAPTGIMYRKIASMGYKSVAHYLIQTQRPETNGANKSSVPPSQESAKTSLAFSNTEEAAPEEPGEIKHDQDTPAEQPHSEEPSVQTQRPETNGANKSSVPPSQESAKTSLAFSNTEEAAPEEPGEIKHDQDTPAEQPHSEEPKPGSGTPVLNSKRKIWVCSPESEVDPDYAKFISATPPKSEGRRDNKLKGAQENDKMVIDLAAGQRRQSRGLKVVSDDNNEVEITMVKEGKPSGDTIVDRAAAPSPDSIGARLLQRRRLGA